MIKSLENAKSSNAATEQRVQVHSSSQAVNAVKQQEARLHLSIGDAKKLPCRPRLVADLLLLPNLGVFLVRVERTLCDRELDEGVLRS